MPDHRGRAIVAHLAVLPWLRAVSGAAPGAENESADDAAGLWRRAAADPLLQASHLEGVIAESPDAGVLADAIEEHGAWLDKAVQVALRRGPQSRRHRLASHVAWFAVFVTRFLGSPVVEAGLDKQIMARLDCSQYEEHVNRLLRPPGPEPRGEGGCPAGSFPKQVRRAPRFRICLRHGQLVDRRILRFGSWDDCDLLTRLSRRWGRPARVLEVGAYNGICALGFAAAGAEVVAVEAHPESAALVRASAALNGFHSLRVVHSAVGAPGWARLVEFGGNAAGSGLRGGGGGSARTAEPAEALARLGVRAGPREAWLLGRLREARRSFRSSWQSLPVPVRGLDEVLQGSGGRPFDLVKLDTNGNEAEVLAAAPALLSTRPPVVQCEIFPGDAEGLAAAALRLLWGHGYSIFAEEDGMVLLSPASLEAQLERLAETRKYIDVVAVDPSWGRRRPDLLALVTRNASEHGADPNALNGFGESPLQLVAKSGGGDFLPAAAARHMAEVLLRAGACPHAAAAAATSAAQDPELLLLLCRWSSWWRCRVLAWIRSRGKGSPLCGLMPELLVQVSRFL